MNCWGYGFSLDVRAGGAISSPWRAPAGLRREAKVYGIKLDKSRRPVEASLAKVAPEFVLVEAELD